MHPVSPSVRRLAALVAVASACLGVAAAGASARTRPSALDRQPLQHEVSLEAFGPSGLDFGDDALHPSSRHLLQVGSGSMGGTNGQDVSFKPAATAMDVDTDGSVAIFAAGSGTSTGEQSRVMQNDLSMSVGTQATLDISTTGPTLRIVDLQSSTGGVYFAMLVQGDSISDSESSTVWSTVSVTAERTRLVVGELARGLSPSWARAVPTPSANVTNARIAVSDSAVYYAIDLDRNGVRHPAVGAFSRSGSADADDVDLTEFTNSANHKVIGLGVATLSDDTARVVMTTQVHSSFLYCYRASMDLTLVESAETDPDAAMVASTVLPVGGNAHLLVVGADSNSELFAAIPVHDPSSLGSFSTLRGEFLIDVTSISAVPLLDNHFSVGGSNNDQQPHYVVASINTALTSVSSTYSPSDPTTGASVSSFALVLGIHSAAHDITFLLGDPATTTQEGAVVVSTICPPGTTKEGGVCAFCDAGYFADTYYDIECSACAAGSFSDSEKSTSCTLCPKGSANPDTAQTGCSVCGSGTYQDEVGQASCKSCPAGTFYGGTNGTSLTVCQPCSAGSYSDAGAASCTACEAGTYSDSGSATCMPCDAGTYSDSGSWNCTTCGAGTWSGPGASSCSDCPVGTYSGDSGLTSADECTDCPAGTSNPNTGSTDAAACTDCSAGTYNPDAGAGSCTQCPAGTYSGTTGNTAESDCTDCPVGTYSAATGATSDATCTDCPRGTYGDSTGAASEDACTACAQGTYQDQVGAISSAACTNCPAGTYGAAPALAFEWDCSNCTAGTYNPDPGGASADACVDCPAGSFGQTDRAVSTSDCTNCTAGTYNPTAGQAGESSCLNCANGTYSDDAGADQCAFCTLGSSAPEASVAPDDCSTCSAGRYSDRETTPEREQLCAACGKGKFNPYAGGTDASYCDDCPAGTYGPLAVATNVDDCVFCPTGTYGPNTGAEQASDCVDCPAGTYNEFNGQDEETDCSECPLGTASPDTGATSSSTCDPCGNGTYADSTGSTACALCPAGWYGTTSDDRTSLTLACDQCPAGTWSDQSGSISADVCTDCGKGKYNDEAGAASEDRCTMCPAGTYSDTLGNDALADCTLCPAGTFNVELGQIDVSACEECPTGTYSDTAGADTVADCTDCPAGTYGNATGADQLADCHPCFQGSYSDTLGANTTDTCMLCPAGTWGDAAGLAAVGECTKCPAGTYSPSLGAVAAATCLECPIGTFAPDAGTAECTPCPAGTFGITTGGDSQAGACEACPAGYNSTALGADSNDTCVLCTRGHYADAGSALCTPCLAGTYLDAVGGTTQDQCTSCPTGTYSAVVGAPTLSSCLNCSLGTATAIPGSTECSTCPAGRVALEVGMVECKPCPPPTFAESPVECRLCQSNRILSDIGDACVRKCAAGSVPNELHTACEECPVGTFAPAEGTATCQQCQPGEYQGSRGQVQCDTCPLGTYINATAAEACTDCPAGRTTTSRGRIVQSECYCADGTFSLDIEDFTTACQACPTGGACEAGRAPVAQEGYWYTVLDMGTFFPCAPSEACPGGDLASADMQGTSKDLSLECMVKIWQKANEPPVGASDTCPQPETSEQQDPGNDGLSVAATPCSEGYSGERCSECAVQWYRLGSRCQPCPSYKQLFLIVFVLALVLLVWLVNLLLRSGVNLAAVTIAMDFFQVLAKFSKFNLRWSSAVEEVMAPLTFVEMDLQVAAPECFVDNVDFSRQWLIVNALPLIILGSLTLYHLGFRLVHCFTRGDSRPIVREHFMRRVGEFMLLLQVFYLMLATKTIQVFDCTELPDGSLELDASPSTRCWEGEHLMLVGLGVLTVLGYVLGIPLCFWLLLRWAKRKSLREHVIIARIDEHADRIMDAVTERVKRYSGADSIAAAAAGAPQTPEAGGRKPVKSLLRDSGPKREGAELLETLADAARRRRHRFLSLYPLMMEEERQLLIDLAQRRSKRVQEFELMDHACGSIYRRFRLERYYWLIVLQLRKVGLVYFFVMLTARPMIAAGLVGLVLVVALRFQLIHRPYAPFDAASSFRIPPRLVAARAKEEEEVARAKEEIENEQQQRRRKVLNRMKSYRSQRNVHPSALAGAAAQDADDSPKAEAVPREAAAGARKRAVLQRSASVRQRAQESLEREHEVKTLAERGAEGDKEAKLIAAAARGNLAAKMQLQLRKVTSDPNLMEAVSLLSATLVLFAGQLYRASEKEVASTSDDSATSDDGSTSSSAHPSLLAYQGLPNTIVVDIFCIMLIVSASLYMMALVMLPLRDALLGIVGQMGHQLRCCRGIGLWADRRRLELQGLTREEARSADVEMSMLNKKGKVKDEALQAWAPENPDDYRPDVTTAAVVAGGLTTAGGVALGTGFE